ncbi:MAG: HD domain-containing protein [Solitalea-like symbiont of Acarus siro]
MITFFSTEENKVILKLYKTLISGFKIPVNSEGIKTIRKAFLISYEAHKTMRRVSGEPYIYHPLEVAIICAKEIGLGVTSVVCALLHDTVEDTDLTLDDIEKNFGKAAANIINGLTKISSINEHDKSATQVENFRKMILTISDDLRVIIIKLADRLHNLRTLRHMPEVKQIKIASETLYLYAPIAHRLGLNTIKTELEDLSLKYTEASTYKFIAKKLNQKKAERQTFINEFIRPIQEALKKQNLNGKVVGRPKSIYSIWNKIRNKQITY